MSYSIVAGLVSGQRLYLCSIDGNIVGDTEQHDVHHKYVQTEHVDTLAAVQRALAQSLNIIDGYKLFVGEMNNLARERGEQIESLQQQAEAAQEGSNG